MENCSILDESSFSEFSSSRHFSVCYQKCTFSPKVKISFRFQVAVAAVRVLVRTRVVTDQVATVLVVARGFPAEVEAQAVHEAIIAPILHLSNFIYTFRNFGSLLPEINSRYECWKEGFREFCGFGHKLSSNDIYSDQANRSRMGSRTPCSLEIRHI